MAIVHRLSLILCLGLALGAGCKLRNKDSRLRSTGQSRMESYLPIESTAPLKVGNIFQIRLSDNSEQCLVPFLDDLNTRQCDGKAHWQLAYIDPSDAAIVRFQHTIAPVCIQSSGGKLKLTSITKPDGSIDCNDPKFNIRIAKGVITDSGAKVLNYMGGKSPGVQLYIPASSDDLPFIVDSWNRDVNYGPAFRLPAQLAARTAYQSDGWSQSNKRWLQMIAIYSSADKTRISGIKTIYSDGSTATTNELGSCAGNITTAGCANIGFYELDSPPNGPVTPDNLNKMNFLSKVTVVHNNNYIIGLKLKGNTSSEQVFMASAADKTGAVEVELKPAIADKDQIVFGFYGSYGQVDTTPASGYFKDLGIIASKQITYANTWNDETTTSAGQTVFIRQNGKIISPFGITAPPGSTAPGYFESITPTDSTNRHWISGIELYSNGGISEILRVGFTHWPAWETNDVIGMQVTHSFVDSEGSSRQNTLTIGNTSPTKMQSITFNEYEYIAKLEYKALSQGFSETIDGANQYTYVPTAGVAALRITIGNIRSPSKGRVISWDASDPASARTTTGSFGSMKFSPWQSFDDRPDRAIVGFYGQASNIPNPTSDNRDRKIDAIIALGPISTTVGCAFRFKTFSAEDIAAIQQVGLIKFEDVGSTKKPSCIPPTPGK